MQQPEAWVWKSYCAQLACIHFVLPHTYASQKTMIDFFKNLKKGEGKEEEEEAKSS